MRPKRLCPWSYRILLFSFLAPFSLAPAAGLSPVRVNMPLRRVSFPEHFSEGERGALFVAGVFPNSCYRTGPTEIAVDEARETISLRQTAYVVLAYCDQTLVPFVQVVSVGPLKAGSYHVLDAVNQGELGWLRVTPRP